MTDDKDCCTCCDADECDPCPGCDCCCCCCTDYEEGQKCKCSPTNPC